MSIFLIYYVKSWIRTSIDDVVVVVYIHSTIERRKIVLRIQASKDLN